MKNLILVFVSLIAFISLSAAAQSPADKQKNFTLSDQTVKEYLKNWSESEEIQKYEENPSLLGKLVENKSLGDFDEVPSWISQTVVIDDKKLQKLAMRMETIYRVIPEMRQIKLVYFTNAQPFFALGNKSLLFISTSSVENLEKDEFTAAGFHELAHLIFADYYWNLRRAGELTAVKQIEMNCDRFSYLMLKRSDISTKNLEKVLRKMDKLEKEGQRDEVEAQFYPNLNERLNNLKKFN